MRPFCTHECRIGQQNKPIHDRAANPSRIEMRVLDDGGHGDGQIEKHRAGDLYDLAARIRRAERPVGDWHTARIRVDGDEVQHWLNGLNVAEITRGSRE